MNKVFPAFLAELEDLIRQTNSPELADQVAELRVVGRCQCGQDDCAHFYTAPPPKGSYGPGHSNLCLPSTTGLIVLDIVDGAIVAVEVLDRPDVKAPLDREFFAVGGSE